MQFQDIERIEIVYGRNAALYGSNAALGVINIITKKPKVNETFSLYGLGGNQKTCRGGAAFEKAGPDAGFRPGLLASMPARPIARPGRWRSSWRETTSSIRGMSSSPTASKSPDSTMAVLFWSFKRSRQEWVRCLRNLLRTGR